MKLFRPVGLNELRFMYDAGMLAFPPRIPEQPIFYPVLNQPYAEAIASKWNSQEAPYAGYVTEFEIDDDYAARFEIQCVGDRNDLELWVPAVELSEFNRHIETPITVIRTFFASEFIGEIPTQFMLANRNASEQLEHLSEILNYNPMDFHCEIAANAKAIFLNFGFWLAASRKLLNLPEERKQVVLERIRCDWVRYGKRPRLPSHGELAS